MSGIASPDRAGYLVGVFLPDRAPEGSPPPNLDFEGDYDFVRLSPMLAQLFFIGDGRAGDGSAQRVDVPGGATRLFLGIADAFDFRGPPGFFDDNTGSFRVDVRFR